MTRVIGVDPSITATGIALPDGTYKVTGGPAEMGEARLAVIFEDVDFACLVHKPHLAVIEGPFVGQKNNTVQLAMVHGVVRLALQKHGVPYAVIAPSALKKYATGDGGATKPDMRMVLYKRTGIDERNDNVIDAIFLQAAGLQVVGKPSIKLPAAQVATLSKIDWPEL